MTCLLPTSKRGREIFSLYMHLGFHLLQTFKDMRLYSSCFGVLGVKILWHVHYFIDTHHHEYYAITRPAGDGIWCSVSNRRRGVRGILYRLFGEQHVREGEFLAMECKEFIDRLQGSQECLATTAFGSLTFLVSAVLMVIVAEHHFGLTLDIFGFVNLLTTPHRKDISMHLHHTKIYTTDFLMSSAFTFLLY